MAEAWYYARDANRIGPFSGSQLKNLAALGSILRTDTIWKEGVEKGVLASKVKNLFSVIAVTGLSNLPAGTPAAAELISVVASHSSTLEEPSPATNSAETSQEKPAATLQKPVIAQRPVRKGRAVATKGADIVSQDGFKAKYRRKCTVCGNKDLAVQTIVITNRTTNAGYYCPKCKKMRVVTIQCTAG
jgi:hypothetical protein